MVPNKKNLASGHFTYTIKPISLFGKGYVTEQKNHIIFLYRTAPHGQEFFFIPILPFDSFLFYKNVMMSQAQITGYPYTAFHIYSCCCLKLVETVGIKPTTGALQVLLDLLEHAPPD